MPDNYGLDRSFDFPEFSPLPDQRPLSLTTLQSDITKMMDYLKKSREAQLSRFDDLARRSNEFLYERQAPAESLSISGDQNDYQLGNAVYHRITTDASRTITGFVAPVLDGLEHWIINVGSNDLIIAHQSASSAAANRVITIAGANVTLSANGMMMIWYDATTVRWREISPQR